MIPLFTNPGSRIIELHCLENVIQKLHWFTSWIHANLSFSIAAPGINHGVGGGERHALSMSTVFGERGGGHVGDRGEWENQELMSENVLNVNKIQWLNKNLSVLKLFMLFHVRTESEPTPHHIFKTMALNDALNGV